MFHLGVTSIAFDRRVVTLRGVLFRHCCFPFAIVAIIVFVSIPMFVIVGIVIVVVLSTSTDSARGHLSFCFVAVSLVQDSHPFIVFVGWRPRLKRKRGGFPVKGAISRSRRYPSPSA